MNKITVNATKPYNVIIGNKLLQNAGTILSDIKPSCTVALVSNETIAPLYAADLKDNLEKAGYRVFCYSIPDGECYKTSETYLKLVHFLAENRLTRSDLIVALGGGVVGDLTGFAAATYLRGIDLVQIPTTLLAMVDSSVGGKTAIDLPQGKNLLGAFYQPRLVLCDPSTLDTLPDSIFLDGCAEVIKYSILYDKELYNHLLIHGVKFDRQMVITRCIELKKIAVEEDEFDNGSRQKLNLGHTVGHAIEKNSKYTISHGMAVAAGMGIITKSAWALGVCQKTVYESIQAILKKFKLPAVMSALPCSLNFDNCARELSQAALADKKRNGNTLNLVLPVQVGHCIVQKTPIEQLEAIIESGL